MAGSDRDLVGWFCGFAFVISSQRWPLWPLVGLSHPFPPAVFSRATSSAMLRSCDCVSCFATKVPISLLLRLLGRWYLFLHFALLQLPRDARLLSRNRHATPRSSPLELLGGCCGILACVAIISLFFLCDLVEHCCVALDASRRGFAFAHLLHVACRLGRRVLR